MPNGNRFPLGPVGFRRTLLRHAPRGFTLIELILVLAVGSMITLLSFQGMKRQTESSQAQVVGQQLRTVGQATDTYIATRYSQISQMISASGTPSDPGPRTCSGSTCTITVQTLVNESLLPPTYQNLNSFGSGYTITLTVGGTAPNWSVTGMVTTTNPWSVGGVIRYDLLGQAMAAAGADSGMSRASASRIDGYGGVWNAPISSSPALGLLGFQVGTGTTLYSVYLRRDGTLPMTGDLNLSDGINHNIYNASNVTGTGRFTSTQAYTNYVNLAGNLDMSGTATIQGNADVNGQVLAQGTVWSATGLQTSGAVSAGSTITANGDITGHYLAPTGASTLGGPCSKNGEIGTDGNKTMFCQLGIWLPSSYAYPDALDTNSFHGSGLGPTTLPMAIPSGATYAMMTSSGHCYSAPGDSCEIFINGVLAQISQAPTGGGSIWQSVSTGWTPDASLILAGGTMTVVVENVNSGGSVTAAPTYGRMDVTWFFE